MAAVAVEFDMGGGLAGRRTQRFDNLKRSLVDDMKSVPVRPEKDIGPGKARIVVTAHEKAGPEGLQRPDHRPVGHVDDADPGAFEMRRRHDRAAAPGPGDAGTQMRQTGNVDVGDLSADHQVDDLAVSGVAGGAYEMFIGAVEEEVVEIVVKADLADGKGLRLLRRALNAVVVDEAVSGRVVSVKHFPDLRDVL